ncbi:MAG TPA: TrbI/VirB10 family protein [Xanthobacteraceae bacterium]|nr:TrbI/VirB10 family protein [Xanthobacteraceae bacterium]
MADEPVTSPAAPVSDHRPVPRGVLPRRFQTWLMAGLAFGILLIILITGQPEPTQGPTQSQPAPVAPNPDRLRDYQERLRAMEARQTLQAEPAQPAVSQVPRVEEPAGPAPEDPIQTDRKRREYESLFASNVVLSRRPEAERPDVGRSIGFSQDEARRDNPTPSLDEIASAVVRATGTPSSNGGRLVEPVTSVDPNQQPADPRPDGREERTPERTDAISAAGPLHPLLEGTVIDTVLTNRLDGSGISPVNCLVTNPVYSHSGQHVLIPAGARVLGETRPVQALGETRLAVAFHRLLMPDGSTRRLDQFIGLNQIGDAGLKDKVNHHYWSTFGAAAAVGLISGLAQWIGSAGYSSGSGDRTVIIASGADAASQASLQVMSRFLNRLPTVTIREGHRVKVYITSDLQLPAYQARESNAITSRSRRPQ